MDDIEALKIEVLIVIILLTIIGIMLTKFLADIDFSLWAIKKRLENKQEDE